MSSLNENSPEKEKKRSTKSPRSSISRIPPAVARQSSLLENYHASGVSVLLSDYSKFGFAERICYHFDLIGTLTSTPLSKNNTQDNNSEQLKATLPPIIATEGEDDDQFPTFQSSKNPVCGVSSLLECVPHSALNKLPKRHRRLLRSRFKEFNSKARLARFTSSSSLSSSNERSNCHQPKSLPLKLTPTTRFSFAYEITSVVLCLDASPSLVATFGNHNEKDDAICALDRLGPMVKKYFGALVQSIPGSVSPSAIDAGLISSGKLSFNEDHGPKMSKNVGSSNNSLPSLEQDYKREEGWSPELAVTVIALYPDDNHRSHNEIPQNSFSSYDNEETLDEEKKTNRSDVHHDRFNNDIYEQINDKKMSMLVRDYRIVDEASANKLATKIREWAMKEVESAIAARWCGSFPSSRRFISCDQEMPDEWTALSSSSLNDMINASKNALSITLPPEGRPCFVIATDCRSVSCDSILETASNQNLEDTPIHVLDLSASQSHRKTRPWEKESLSPQNINKTSNIEAAVNKVPYNQPLFLSVDHDGPFSFPLNLSDESEALYEICRHTGGCFFDQHLLNLAVKTVAGNVDSDSPFYNDNYFSLRRRTLWPNAVQWYTIFSLSNVCPLTGGSWGKIPSPKYIRQKQRNLQSKNEVTALKNKSVDLDSTLHGSKSSLLQKGSRITFLKYDLSPIRAKGILLMRFKDGFRAKRYGHNTKDPDKVSLHLTLRLEYGTSLHYEFSFVANPYHNAMVGSANVEIKLSGDPSFVQFVKNDFITHQINSNATVYQSPYFTVSQTVSARICKFLKFIKEEDILESHLCPLEWKDQLTTANSVFLKTIKELTAIQLHRHFQSDQFNIICTGGNRFVNQDTILSEFVEVDYGDKEIYDTLSKWSTHIIMQEELYVRQIISSDSDLTYYCTLKVTRSNVAARLFSIRIDFFGSLDTQLRLDITEELRSQLLLDEHLLIPSIMISEYLVNPYTRSSIDEKLPTSYSVGNFFHHETWELLNDPEVLPLISRRRSFFGNFILLEESNSHAIFTKFLAANDRYYLVQYFIKVFKNRVTVHMFMEKEHGRFSRPIYPSSTPNKNTKFYPIFDTLLKKVKDRDLKCGNALRSRRNLLSIFEDKNPIDAGYKDSSNVDHTKDVKLLLAYSSREVKKLRFFKPGSGNANEILADLLVSFILSDGFDMQVARVNVDSDKLEGIDAGDWFIIRHDWHTISLALFPVLKKPNEDASKIFSTAYHDFTLYTSSIADLYYMKTDIVDDDSTVGNDTENQCVSEVFDALDNVYDRIYARAAYLALMKSSPTNTFESFDEDDFNQVIASCIESKIANVVISQENQVLTGYASTTAGEKLKALLSQMVSPVPGGGVYSYFRSPEISAIINELNDENDDMNSDHYDSVTTVSDPDSADETVPPLNEQSRFVSAETNEFSLTEGNVNDPFDEQSNFGFSESSQCMVADHSLQPPMFLKFTLNGRTVSLDDISTMTSTSNLHAYITVFEDSKRLLDTKLQSLSREMPTTHSAVAHRLVTSLNSFVAEQTLERLRHIGPNISDIDLKTVKKRLLEANSVITKTIPLQFYVSRVDKMVSGSEENVTEGILEGAFELLRKELGEQKMIIMKQTKTRDFFVTDGTRTGCALQYWCFIKVPKNSGPLTLYIYHPSGKEKSEQIAQKVMSVVTDTNHRVNQIILLERLHKTRTAISLLIEENITVGSSVHNDSGDERSDVNMHKPSHLGTTFEPGHFKCPITFQSRYILNHRCSVAQAIMSLESSILQNFVVSNRPRIFVYRDEEEHVFYITLKPYNLPNTSEINYIQLLVHGITKPGPSITQQLDRLLQKKLLSKYLDIMSNLLTKNPRFNLLPEDMKFFRSFQNEWQRLENTEESKTVTHEEVYAIPSFCYDPVMLLMYFRQNITGSTFFHTLHESGSDERSGNSNTPEVNNDYERDPLDVKFKFAPQDFSLFYNTKPSQLDPDYQPVSTLTDAGKNFLQETGSGLAIIEVNLLDKQYAPLDYVYIGGVPRNKSTAPIGSDLCFQKVNDISADSLDSVEVYLSITITNTKLNTNVIHKWLEMTLNQVLMGWHIERHLQNSMMSSIGTYTKNHDNPLLSAIKSRDHLNDDPIDTFCPGHSYLRSLLESADYLPHPGVKKSEFKGTIKSTMISRLTVNILEQCVLSTIFNEKKINIKDIRGLQIVRKSSITNSKKSVQLFRKDGSKEVTTHILETGKDITDCPTDSPIYICTYGLSPDTEAPRKEKRRGTLAPPLTSLLFQQVATENLHDSSKKSLVDAVTLLKSKNPPVFYRHIAFIMIVSRTSCCILAYNWNPQYHVSIIQKAKELFDDAVRLTKKSNMTQQMKCFYNLDIPGYTEYSYGEPFTNVEQRIEKKGSNNQRRKEEMNQKQKKDSKLQSIEEKPGVASKRIPRPTKILRPTLVGKSVDGSASRAVAASRARASARTMPSKKKSSNVSNKVAASVKKSLPSSGKEISGLQKSQTKGQDRSQHSQSRESLSLSKHSVTREKGLHDEPHNRLSNLPASHQRDLLSLLSQSSFIPRNLLFYGTKQLMCNWLSNMKGNEVNATVLEHILSHSIILRSFTIPVIKSVESIKNHLLHHLAKTFARDLSDLFCVSNGKMISVSGAVRNTRSKRETAVVYVRTTPIIQKSCRVNLVYRLSTMRHPLTKNMNVMCNCYLLMDTYPGSILDSINDKNTNIFQWNKVTKRRLKASESVSSQLDSFVNSQLDNVNIPGKIFHFVLSFIRSYVLQSNQSLMVKYNIPSILREIFDIYPISVQERLNGCCWRLLYRMLSISFDRDSPNNSIPNSKLLLELSKNPALYGVKNFSGDEICIFCQGTKLSGKTFLFLMRNKSSDEFLDLFVLCVTDSINLNNFTFLNKSRYAVRIFEEIYLDCYHIVKKLCQEVAFEVKRISHWEKITQAEKADTRIKIEDILGLRIMPFIVHLEEFDAHFMTLLYDAEADLELEWESLFYSMRQDKTFANAISFVDEHTGNVMTSFKVTDEILLLFEIDVECKLKSADIIMKNCSLRVQEPEKLVEVVRITVTFILNWIWTHL